MTIAYSALPDSTPVGTVQAILAVGTTKQINNFKKSKSLRLVSCNSFIRFPSELYAAQDIATTDISGRTTNKTEIMSTENGVSGSGANSAQNNLTSMFSTFIDNLAARLPDRNSIDSIVTEAKATATTTTTTSDATTQTNELINTNEMSKTTTATTTTTANGKYMRPTSELLDDLQRALAINPTAGQKKGLGLAPISTAPEQRSTATSTSEPQQSNAMPPPPPPKMFRVHIEIENALHLPTFAVPPHKKGGKRNRNANSNGSGCSSSGSTTLEIEPNTYVTFEATATNVLSDSTTYTTNIVEASCSPRWNKQFEIYLPAEYLQNVSVPLDLVTEFSLRKLEMK